MSDKKIMFVGDRIDHTTRSPKNSTTNQKIAAHKAQTSVDRLDKLLEHESKVCKSMFKVLIVDDDADIRNTNKELFLTMGFRNVSTAANGELAKTYLVEHPFDLVISDYRMPLMDGYELFQFCQGLEKVPTFLMVTAFNSNSEVTNLKQAGVTIIQKPFKIKKLQTLILGIYLRVLDEIKKEHLA